MKILIATGICPPDIGGPAIYAKALSEELPRVGCEVKIITYSDNKISQPQVYKISRRNNILLRYFKYFWHVWKLRKWADIIYAFDLISVGLPCALVKLFKPKTKLIVRLGGDYQWETALQKGLYNNILEQYYIDKKFNLFERLVYFINNFVLSMADCIIFNACILRDIYVKYRNIKKEKAIIIRNISPEIDYIPKEQKKDYVNILFAGRLTACRNLPILIESFSNIRNNWPKKVILEIIGEGDEREKIINLIKEKKLEEKVKISPKLNRNKLLNKIANSDIISLVSLTEINSNFISEALALNKPVILTKINEFHYIGDKRDLIYYIDPLNTQDITDKIELALSRLFGGYIYQKQEEKKDISWDIGEVIKKHLEIFTKIKNEEIHKEN